MNQDLYIILGISRSANDDEIKKAYRKLAREHHPDHNPDNPDAEERFKELSAAYSILSDPEKKAHYDRFGMAGPGGGPGGGMGDFFEDVISDFFGGGRRRQQRAAAGADLRYRLRLTLEDIAEGVTREIEFERAGLCETCDGTGAEDPSDVKTCGQCQGSGQVRMQQGFFVVQQTCNVCRGRGKVINTPCVDCRGNGQIRIERNLEVTIPPGVGDGTRLRLRNEGEPGPNGGPSGDLYVEMQIEKHAFFVRNESDLYLELPVPVSIAILGGEVEVPLLGGGIEAVKVDAGLETGNEIRVRNAGLPGQIRRRRGDIVAIAKVVMPDKLNRGEKKDLEKALKNISDDRYSALKDFKKRVKRTNP